MRILYFGYDGFDTQNGTNHLAIKLIDYLLKEGYDVDLLTSHTTGVFDDIPSILKGRSGFKYNIVMRKIIKKSSFAKRYLQGIKYAYDCKKIWMKKRKEIDVVILQSTQTAFFSSRLLKKYFKGKVLFNSYDVFPNVAYDTGVLRNKFLFKILLKMQKKLYENSDAIIVISSDMKKNLIEQGVPERKIVEINNWYDDDNVRVIDRKNNKFVRKYNISSDKFCVQYAGNYGITFDYKYVLAVAKLLENNKHVVFQMIGSGMHEEQFKKEASSLSNIEFYPWQPLDMIADVYSACDVELIPLSKGVIRNSFPSKGSLLMACGKVIICATEHDSDYYSFINSSKAGFCVSNSNPQEAADTIKKLFNNRKIIKKMGEKAKEFGLEYYSSGVCLPKIKDLLFLKGGN